MYFRLKYIDSISQSGNHWRKIEGHSLAILMNPLRPDGSEEVGIYHLAEGQWPKFLATAKDERAAQRKIRIILKGKGAPHDA